MASNNEMSASNKTPHSERLHFHSKGDSSFTITMSIVYKLVLFLLHISVLCSATVDPPGPSYLGHACNSPTVPANSTYQFHLTTILSSLSSNSTGNNQFYNTTVTGSNSSDTVYGLFMCRGDELPQLCHKCIVLAAAQISSVCPLKKEAIVWYVECFLRYSNRYIFSTVDTRPSYGLKNTEDASQESYLSVLLNTLNLTAEKAANASVGAKKYGTTEASISGFGTMYSMAQCTPDLSSQDCRSCLSGAIGDLPDCCAGKRGGRILYPSCDVRYELYRFYDTAVSPAAAPSPLQPPGNSSEPDGKVKGKLSTTIIVVVVVVSIFVAGILFHLAFCLIRSQMKKRRMALLRQSYFGNESSTLEPLEFSLATIEAATNKFSQENSIGKGGYGEVYKGNLINGEEIAVKRLSTASGQGATEFKNEVLLIAKLQHRNLVALLGFCIEEQEKILVYEYVPNKSLDFFLFGSQDCGVLNWSERCKIIGGVARGILYLHEYSRLKIIHRDLKPSNILLDNEMNPKVSDFGLAKIVAINENEGSTKRIVGTYGYMSPEYAMFGIYSEKSDIFSFGVIVLEIISGKKNTSFQDQSQYADSLLSYAWNQWRDEKLLDILDSRIEEFGSYNEVIKCIQIGLLCVQENPEARPSMATVVSYLSNDSVQIPFPEQPAFFLHGRMELNTASGSKASCSTNEVSMTEFFPR